MNPTRPEAQLSLCIHTTVLSSPQSIPRDLGVKLPQALANRNGINRIPSTIFCPQYTINSPQNIEHHRIERLKIELEEEKKAEVARLVELKRLEQKQRNLEVERDLEDLACEQRELERVRTRCRISKSNCSDDGRNQTNSILLIMIIKENVCSSQTRNIRRRFIENLFPLFTGFRKLSPHNPAHTTIPQEALERQHEIVTSGPRYRQLMRHCVHILTKQEVWSFVFANDVLRKSGLLSFKVRESVLISRVA
jgi:hypothetical protein